MHKARGISSLKVIFFTCYDFSYGNASYNDSFSIPKGAGYFSIKSNRLLKDLQSKYLLCNSALRLDVASHVTGY